MGTYQFDNQIIHKHTNLVMKVFYSPNTNARICVVNERRRSTAGGRDNVYGRTKCKDVCTLSYSQK